MTTTAISTRLGQLAIILSWNSQELLTKTVAWVNAKRWRRWIIWPFVATQAWLIFTTALAPEAMASGMSAFGTSAIAWMGIKDSHGVPVAAYQMSINHGSVRRPGPLGTSPIIQTEFGMWVVWSALAIWFICWVLSFDWLDLFADGFLAMSNALTSTVSTPVILAAAVTIGSIPIAWHFVRGQMSKAGLQLGMVIVVALLSTTVLANPVSMMLGSDGALAQSRNVGLAATSSLAGKPSSDAGALIDDLQSQMVDAFIRAPLQQWNFGTVIDADEPACSNAWTTAQLSGNEDKIKDSIATCLSPNAKAMKYVADHPSGGMIATGMMLLVLGGILQLFAVALGMMIIIDGFAAIWEGFKLIIGFAITGYIPGGFQASLWTSAISAALAVVQMAAYVVFLGGWAMLLMKILSNPNLNGIAGITACGILLLAGIVLVWRMRKKRKQAATTASTKINSTVDNPTSNSPVRPHARLHSLSEGLRDTRTAYSGTSRAIQGARQVLQAKVPATAADSPATTSLIKSVERRRQEEAIAQRSQTSGQQAPLVEPTTTPNKTKKAAHTITNIGLQAAAAAATGGGSAAAKAAGTAAAKTAGAAAANAAVTKAGKQPHATPGPIPPPPNLQAGQPGLVDEPESAAPAPAGRSQSSRSPVPATGQPSLWPAPTKDKEVDPPAPAPQHPPQKAKRSAVDYHWVTPDTADEPEAVAAPRRQLSTPPN